MKKAKALIFPSRLYETAGLTVLEAQSLGVSCIASGSCVTKEFIKEGKNGYLFGGLEELKDVIKKSDKIKNFKIDELTKYNENNYVFTIKNFFLKL